jgi:hypothetical protein
MLMQRNYVRRRPAAAPASKENSARYAQAQY